MIGIDPTLGYWIAKEHWVQWYVREAAHAVLSAYFHDPLPFQFTAVILLKTKALHVFWRVWAFHPWANQ